VVVVQQFSGLPSALPAVKDTVVGVSLERRLAARNTVTVTSAGLSTETVTTSLISCVRNCRRQILAYFMFMALYIPDVY